MSEQLTKKGSEYGFIPRPLVVEDYEELSVFPHNIMFMSFANIDGVDTSGTALYEPFICSYKVEENEERGGETKSMRYLNSVDEEDYIDIEYLTHDESYIGRKYIKNCKALTAIGSDWKQFFIHLTITGLSKGETCEFKPLEQQD